MAQTKVSLIKDNVIVAGHLHTNHGITTDHIGEGSTRQYFTTDRVQTFLTTNNYIKTTDVANLETTTSLSLNANILSYVDEAGNTTNIDLSLYLDDSNLARIVSGSLNSGTGVATFTRDDASTFTVDFSAFLSDANDYVTSASFNTTSGVLTLTRLGGGTVTVDLDGKYSLLGHTHSWSEITGKPSTFTPSSHNHDDRYYTETESDARFAPKSAYDIYGTGYGWLMNDYDGSSNKMRIYYDDGTKEVRFYSYHGAVGAAKISLHSGSSFTSFGSSEISNWNTAYGWGNHASAGYLTSLPSHDHTILKEAGSISYGTPGLQWFDLSGVGGSGVNGGTPSNPFNDWHHHLIMNHANSAGYYVDMAYSFHDDRVHFRRNAGNSFGSWREFIHSGNIGSFAITSETDTLDSVADRGRSTNQQLISTNPAGFRVDSGSYARIELDSTDNWSYVRLQDQGVTTWDIACYNSGNLEWRPGGGETNRMTLSQSGYLTINGSMKVVGGVIDMNNNDGFVYDDGSNIMYVKLDGTNREIIHSANIGSYALTSLPSHTHDDRYLVKGGSWNATNMPGSRWGGFSANGGEVVFQQDNPNNGQVSVMVDGNFYAGENNGFWSLYNLNDYNQKAGFYTDTSGVLYLNAPNQIRINTNGYGDRLTLNFDQIWTPVGNLYLQYSSAGWVYLNDGGGHTQSATSLRAPIFYDSNNTNYYLDPANITNLHTLQIGRNDTADNNRIDFYSTSAAGYSALRFKFNGNEDNTLHSFGRSWSSGFPYYSRGSFNLSGYYGVTFGAWNNPGAWIYNGGEAQFQSNVKSPIFYDSTDTSYYLDPASTSVLNDVNVNTLNATNMWEGDIYIEGDANTYYPVAWYGGSQAEVCEIEIYRNYSETAPSTWNTSTHKGGLVFRCSTNFGGWGGVSYDIQVQDFRETYSTMMGWMGHFANSRAFGFRLRGGGAIYHVRIKGRSTGPTVTYGTWDPGNNGTGLGTSTSLDTANIVRRRFASGSRLYSYDNLVLDHGSDHQTKSGILQSNSSLRAPILYDSNDTNYYVDPNSSGSSIKVRGTIENPSIWINDGDNYNNYNENIRLFNPSNNGPSVIAFSSTGTGGQPTTSILGYSDRLEQRFGANWQERVRNGYVEASGSYRAPIFYDSNNTGYYCDPASTSNFNTVYLNAQDWGGTITWNTGVNINVSGESSFDLLGSSAIWQVWTANNSQPSIYVTYAGQTEIGLAGNRGLKVHGNLTVNHSSTYGTGMDLTFSGSSATGMLIRNNTGSTKAAISFFYSSAPQGARGTIMVSSTSTAYNTSSDYRLKENFEPITDGIDRVKLLQPKRFNFIGDDKTVDGFVAHEAQEVVPESITGVKDEVDEDGNPVYQGIDQAKLVPLLTAALQEAIAKIESLEDRIQVLENQ